MTTIGDLEIAQELQAKAHEYIEKKLGHDHADTLSSKWDLALTKLKRGQEGALRDLEDVTTARRRVLGEDHPDTLAARHRFSAEKFNLSSNINELAEQADVLRLSVHLLGDEHPTTNSTRVDLSEGYHSIMRLSDAEQLRLKALKVQIKVLPAPKLFEEAKDTYERALMLLGVMQDSFQRTDSDSGLEYTGQEEVEPAPRHCHSQVIASLAALALIYVDMAQSADEAALASVQESDPESEKAHQAIVSGLNQKAIALQRAVICQQMLLDEDEDLQKERYGEDLLEGGAHPRYSYETLECHRKLGLILQAAGEIDQAIAQFELVQDVADDSSILHFTSLSNLGTLLFAAGQYERAETVQARAYAKPEVVGDKEFVVAVFNLALTKVELGKREEALELMDRALRLSREAFGHADPTTVRILDTWTEWQESFSTTLV